MNCHHWVSADPLSRSFFNIFVFFLTFFFHWQGFCSKTFRMDIYIEPAKARPPQLWTELFKVMAIQLYHELLNPSFEFLALRLLAEKHISINFLHSPGSSSRKFSMEVPKDCFRLGAPRSVPKECPKECAQGVCQGVRPRSARRIVFGLGRGSFCSVL